MPRHLRVRLSPQDAGCTTKNPTCGMHYNLCTHSTLTHTKYNVILYICMCVCVCVYVCMYVCMYVYIYIYCMHACMHVCMYVYILYYLIAGCGVHYFFWLCVCIHSIPTRLGGEKSCISSTAVFVCHTTLSFIDFRTSTFPQLCVKCVSGAEMSHGPRNNSRDSLTQKSKLYLRDSHVYDFDKKKRSTMTKK